MPLSSWNELFRKNKTQALTEKQVKYGGKQIQKRWSLRLQVHKLGLEIKELESGSLKGYKIANWSYKNFTTKKSKCNDQTEDHSEDKK